MSKHLEKCPVCDKLSTRSPFVLTMYFFLDLVSLLTSQSWRTIFHTSFPPTPRLEKCNLMPACCQHLSSVLGSSKSLVHLNLLQNDLEPSGVGILWKALKKSTCKLQKLG